MVGMQRHLRRILIIVLATALFAATAGCGGSTPTRTTKPPGSTGRTTAGPAPQHALCFPSRGCQPKGWACSTNTDTSATECRPPGTLRRQITDLDADIQVTYRVSDRAGAKATVISYACPPAAGDSRDAWVSCAALAEDPEMVVPQQHNICTEQYGGPETATVTGHMGRDTIRVQFARTNGCEITDWTRAQVLWDWAIPGARISSAVG